MEDKREIKSFHNPCPYGNDKCPKCKPMKQEDKKCKCTKDFNDPNCWEKPKTEQPRWADEFVEKFSIHFNSSTGIEVVQSFIKNLIDQDKTKFEFNFGEEFDKKFAKTDGWGEEGLQLSNRIKQFITNLIKQRDRELVEAVDKVLEEYKDEGFSVKGRYALQDILDLINKR